MTEASDAELLARFHDGDAAALEAIFERYERVLYQFLLGILRDHHAAEDALQETFVRGLEKLEGVDPDHLRGWLFTVAYHQAMLMKRRQKNQTAASPLSAGPGDQASLLADANPGPALAAEQKEEAIRLRSLLDQLPDPQREVICRRIYEGKRFREIAADLDCPLNTALARMHEGMKRLKSMWKQNHA
ncbi:MAG: RNA polymerase sigma factor [Gemmatales bacterium]|nr:MAG: RNA polymerase sigma factor [Gemmatales bacterium]